MASEDTADIESRQGVSQLLLDNGMQIVWEEDRRQSLVAIEARIKGGLRGEGSYVGSGITHFIEHMLFKGTPSRPAGTIEQEIRKYGGTINAFTSFDATGVSLFVESRYLKEATDLLADILQHALFTQKEFDKERSVVISEIQMNLDDPERRIQQLFWSRHFMEHPYRHPILGYQSQLEGLTVKDLSLFYASQYQPQNITIAFVGDIDAKAIPALVSSAFGSWPRGRVDTRQQLVPVEPKLSSARKIVVELPLQTAYAIIGFSSTRLSDPDMYPLDVLSNIIGQGESSRLYETVVRKKRLAHDIRAWDYTPYDPGIFAIAMRTDPDKVDAAIESVSEVLGDIRRHGVTQAELQKAKRSVSAEYLFSLQTVESKAADLANSLMSTGDPLFSRRYVSGIAQVSLEQVQAAANNYCDVSKMTSAIIRPPAQSHVSEPTKQQPGVIPVKKHVLGNGAVTLIRSNPSLPIAAIVVGFRGGLRVEQENKQGISNIVAQLLTKGTTKSSAPEIARRVESLGSSLEPFSGRDGFGLAMKFLSQDLDDALALVYELLSDSTFPEQEVLIQKQLIANELRAQDDEIFDVGSRLLRRTLFEHHPYRFHPLGTKETIASIHRDDCLKFAKRWLLPSNMVISVFGNVDEQTVQRRLERTFGELPALSSDWPDKLAEDSIDGVRVAKQIMKKEQALVMLGFRGSTYKSADRYALDVMTAVLSGMSGRLFQAVREEHGLSYTLGALNITGWDPGYLLIYAATRPNEQERVLSMIDSQLELALSKDFSQEELDQAKRYLIGLHRLDIQDLGALAKRSTLDELYGVGFDAWTNYEANINGVSTKMVNDAAKRYLTLRKHAQVILSPGGHQ